MPVLATSLVFPCWFNTHASSPRPTPTLLLSLPYRLLSLVGDNRLKTNAFIDELVDQLPKLLAPGITGVPPRATSCSWFFLLHGATLLAATLVQNRPEPAASPLDSGRRRDGRRCGVSGG